MNQTAENTCACCGDVLENGYVVGDSGNGIKIGLLDYSLQWFDGKPTRKKSLMELGEVIGQFEPFIGSYALGKRCKTCRKVILDY